MNRNFLKIFVVSLLLFCGSPQVNACAFFDDPSTNFFSYFYGGEFFPKGYQSVDRFVDQDNFYGFTRVWLPVKNEGKVNVELWSNYFGHKYNDKEIRDFIYHIPVDQIQMAQKDNYDGSNSLVKDLSQKNSSVFQYLLYARSCEPFCNFQYSWNYDQESKESSEYDTQIQKGLSLYNACNDKFLKFRYGYQLIKLYRYNGQFKECVAFYEDMVSGMSQESPVKYWALSQVAGCQNSMGDEVKARHNFLKVYMHCPSRRSVVFRSNMIHSQQQWDDLLNQCTKDEKIALYYLRGQRQNANKMEEARYIYEIDPNSSYIPFLLSAHIRQMESINFSSWEFSKMPFFVNRGTVLGDDSKDDMESTLEFINEVIEKNNTIHIPMFRYAGAYVELLRGNANGAQSYLNNIPFVDQQAHTKQYKTLEAMIILQSIKSPTVADENRMEDYYKLIPDLVQTFMATVYSPDQNMRYTLSHKIFTDLRSQSDTTLVKEAIAWEQSPVNPSWYVNNVLRPRFYKSLPKVELRMPYKEYRQLFLKELLGTQHLNNGAYKAACKVFGELPIEFQERYAAFGVFGNPFNYSVRDFAFPTSMKRYTKYQFSKTLSAIQKKIDQGTATHMDWYLMSNAYQNTSYYGRLWQLKFYFRSSVQVSGPHDLLPVAENFEKAALMSNDREFQAKCYFLAAKARNSNFYADNPYYFTSSNDYAVTPYSDGKLGVVEKLKEMKKKDALKDYDILRRDYKDTEFYKQVIKECQMFMYYCDHL